MAIKPEIRVVSPVLIRVVPGLLVGAWSSWWFNGVHYFDHKLVGIGIVTFQIHWVHVPIDSW